MVTQFTLNSINITATTTIVKCNGMCTYGFEAPTPNSPPIERVTYHHQHLRILFNDKSFI